MLYRMYQSFIASKAIIIFIYIYKIIDNNNKIRTHNIQNITPNVVAYYLQDKKLVQKLRNRGPNCMQTLEIKPCSDITITFHGTVLWMQGLQLTPQPIQNSKGVFLYNGDIFDESWNLDTSDTQIIMDKLNQQIVSLTWHQTIS